jgi:hypothetical protein
MGVPLTRRERWIAQTLFWSDWILLLLAFLLAWFLIGTPAAAKPWSVAAQLVYRVVVCSAVVAGILTLRWWRPVGFVVTFTAYLVLAASQGFSSKAMWLASAGFLTIASIFITEAMSRFWKTSGEH